MKRNFCFITFFVLIFSNLTYSRDTMYVIPEDFGLIFNNTPIDQVMKIG
ncbi:hypothetical protein [uncultured Aquimarina sp.]|nr:hypothetical protein [uncultured Aquimarina sp.]